MSAEFLQRHSSSGELVAFGMLPLKRAWAILGYFYGFMGDTGMFQEYLGLADSFLTDSIERGSTDILPAGFAEIVHHKQTVKAYSGNLDPAHDDSLAARRQHLPEVNPAANEGDLFRYFSQSQTAFEELVFEKACEKSAARRHLSADEPCEEGRCDANPHGNVPQVEEVSDAMVIALKAGLLDFEHLQEAVDRPNIRKGIGGLLINVNLAFQKATNGDTGGALERFGHCVEVFERYPGVCRCMILWCRMSHSLLGALAAIDDSRARELYNRLRDVYNPSRPASFLPAPPLEEWRGTSAFCDDFQCRLFDGIIASQAFSVFSSPPDCTSNYAGLQHEEDDVPVVDEERDGGIAWAGVIPKEVTGSVMVTPCSNGVKPVASPSSWALNQEPAPQTNPPAGSSPSTSHLHRELGRGGASGTAIFNSAVEGCGGGALSGLVGQVPGMSLAWQELRDADGFPDGTGDDTIAEADWLDVSLVMLGAIDENGSAL
ncbi:expressed unknown protein [Ectocarpus siliculosus]|uniref:Uncharacterized protein n=1 Tax=Ectocarpus siliculosus TaxID=2880 RepID=D8LU23_ECTSI|nr:expressed unknown protein [Ectocarpus siliculosus]|eukprot:CBN75413.1 expressed unknown protein [Ectocarpus siliculosus]